jgi:hypothetical protein
VHLANNSNKPPHSNRLMHKDLPMCKVSLSSYIILQLNQPKSSLANIIVYSPVWFLTQWCRASKYMLLKCNQEDISIWLIRNKSLNSNNSPLWVGHQTILLKGNKLQFSNHKLLIKDICPKWWFLASKCQHINLDTQNLISHNRGLFTDEN